MKMLTLQNSSLITSCYLLTDKGELREEYGDCFKELLETIGHICLETKETDIREYQNMLMEYRIVFCLCLMTDNEHILSTSKVC